MQTHLVSDVMVMTHHLVQEHREELIRRQDRIVGEKLAALIINDGITTETNAEIIEWETWSNPDGMDPYIHPKDLKQMQTHVGWGNPALVRMVRVYVEIKMPEGVVQHNQYLHFGTDLGGAYLYSDDKPSSEVALGDVKLMEIGFVKGNFKPGPTEEVDEEGLPISYAKPNIAAVVDKTKSGDPLTAEYIQQQLGSLAIQQGLAEHQKKQPLTAEDILKWKQQLGSFPGILSQEQAQSVYDAAKVAIQQGLAEHQKELFGYIKKQKEAKDEEAPDPATGGPMPEVLPPEA